MPALDIGSAPIDRPSYTPRDNTYILKENPANIDGTLTMVYIWCYRVMATLEVGIFEPLGSDKFTTRSHQTLNDIPVGYSEHPVNLSVKAGDHIGYYALTGEIDRTLAGLGYWYVTGDHLPCTDLWFAPAANRTVSLYGTGVPLGPDYTHCIVQDYQYEMNCQGFIITLETNVPCHMWLNPLINPVWNHPRSHLNRGLLTSYDTYKCINILTEIEQEEAGDTTTHTFIWTGWAWCQTEQFIFTSQNNACPIVTVSPPYKLHYNYAPPLDPCLFCHPAGDKTWWVNLVTDAAVTYMFSPAQDFVLWNITWEMSQEDAGLNIAWIAYRLYRCAPNGFPILPMLNTDLAIAPPPDHPITHTITFKIYPRKLYKGFWYTHGLYVPWTDPVGQSTYLHHTEYNNYTCLPADKCWYKPPGNYPYSYFSVLSSGASCWGYTPYPPFYKRS